MDHTSAGRVVVLSILDLGRAPAEAVGDAQGRAVLEPAAVELRPSRTGVRRKVALRNFT
jgi:hypothetical protein